MYRATLLHRTVAIPLALLISVVVAQDDVCVNTPTKCHCTPTTPSGTCTRTQGDGTCLLSPCASGYRCDCYGYEMCSVARCGKYEAQPGEAQSETVPFRCLLESNKADCIAMTDVLESTSATKHAETEAAGGNDEATAAEVFTVNALEDSQTQKKVMNQMLADLERVADGLNETELAEVSEDSGEFEAAIEEVSGNMTEVADASTKCFNVLRDVRKLKRDALVNGRQADNRRKELEEEEKKAVKDNVKVQKLRGEVDEFDGKRKNAARSCGNKAREGRQWRKDATEGMERCKKAQNRGKKAFSSCIERVKAQLAKASEAAGATTGSGGEF